MKKILSIILTIVLCLSFTACGEQGQGYYGAEIVVKDYGTIRVKLDRETAPITVENFKRLADQEFYNGLTFHRIMEGFMMQGGSTDGIGVEGSNRNITGEFKANGIENNISHKRGVISMARSDDYNSATSQFFIVHQDSEFLDGEYAAFGHVIEGMDVVDKICKTAEPTDNNGTIEKSKQPVIEEIRVVWIPLDDNK